jgi:hypothetical protein
MNFRESYPLARLITEMDIPTGMTTTEDAAYRQAIEDILQLIEQNVRGPLAGADTPESLFARFVTVANQTEPDKTGFLLRYGLSPMYLEQKIPGWSRPYAKQRLDAEVTAGHLILRKIVECDDGHRNDDPEFVAEAEARHGYCYNCGCDELDVHTVYVGPQLPFANIGNSQ